MFLFTSICALVGLNIIFWSYSMDLEDEDCKVKKRNFLRGRLLRPSKNQNSVSRKIVNLSTASFYMYKIETPEV